MDILNNSKIKKIIDAESRIDLYQNNHRLDVVVQIDDDSEKQLTCVFHKLLRNEHLDEGYYMLKRLFQNTCLKDRNKILQIVVSIIADKIVSINDAITDENGNLEDINISKYLQIYRIYMNFTHRLYKFLKCFQKYLVIKKINVERKMTIDILSVIQYGMFYNAITGNKEKNILTIVSEELHDINNNNIKQLVDYLESMITLLSIKHLITIKIVAVEKMIESIKKIMSKKNVVNAMCVYLDKLLKIINSKKHLENVRHIVNKILLIANFIFAYSNIEIAHQIYIKYMQARIINDNYKNLCLERDIVKINSHLLGKKITKKMMEIIMDIADNQKINKVFQNLDYEIVPNKYQKMLNISTCILKPVILTKNVWDIFNTSSLKPKYPPEIRYYLDIIRNEYEKVYNNEYTIDWQPTMGYARFCVELNNIRIEIDCNILQAIALCYLNHNPTTTHIKFANDVQLNKKLSEKIFQSLMEANLICITDREKENYIYVINNLNYTGNSRIDIHSIFLETFEHYS
jgi:transcriptional regulator of met regulon